MSASSKPAYGLVRQLDPEAEDLTAVVLPISMINSVPGAHNISVWDSAASSLVTVRFWALLSGVWRGRRGMKFGVEFLALAGEVYVSFYCLLLEALGTVAIKYL